MLLSVMIRFLARLAVDSHQFHSSPYVHDGLGKSSTLSSFADCIEGFFFSSGQGFSYSLETCFLGSEELKAARYTTVFFFFLVLKKWAWNFPFRVQFRVI
jgi:hypothetical protein